MYQTSVSGDGKQSTSPLYHTINLPLYHSQTVAWNLLLSTVKSRCRLSRCRRRVNDTATFTLDKRCLPFSIAWQHHRPRYRYLWPPYVIWQVIKFLPCGFFLLLSFFTGSIARSANLPVFDLLRGRFWGFSPAGATRCTDGGEIWQEGGDQSTVGYVFANLQPNHQSVAAGPISTSGYYWRPWMYRCHPLCRAVINSQAIKQRLIHTSFQRPRRTWLRDSTRYGDGARDTAEANSSVFSLIRMR